MGGGYSRGTMAVACWWCCGPADAVAVVRLNIRKSLFFFSHLFVVADDVVLQILNIFFKQDNQ